MNSPKFLQKLTIVMLAIVFLAGCRAPAATPALPPTFPPSPPPPATFPPPPPPSSLPTSAPPTVLPSSSLFTLVKETKVTPVGSLAGGLFVRIGYVPGRDRLVVAFKARLSQANGGCTDIWAQAYREYTRDMEETGKYGIIICQTGPDVGGLILGNDFYYATMGRDHDVDGWWLARYDAVTWQVSTPRFFFPLEPEEKNGDPMIAMLDEQIDISGKYKLADEIGPGHATHHQFFTPDLQFVSKRILTDVPHIDLTSLLSANGMIHFITSTDLWGDMLVMQYDMSWKFLGAKTLKAKAAAPEGAAFDGRRFYVAYLDNSLSGQEYLGTRDNIRLAAFDLNWNLLDDIAVTSFVPGDHKAPARPSLALQDNRLYVCYDQGENVMPGSNQIPENTDLQV